MKRVLSLILICFSFVVKAQQPVIYLMGMNAAGQIVINTVPVPAVVNSGAYPDLLSKPTAMSLTTTGTGAATWNVGTNTLNVPTPAAGTTYSSGTGIVISAGVISNTSPDQTVTITAGDGIVVTSTYPNFTLTAATATYNTAVVRALNSNFTVSSTKASTVHYTVRIAYNITVLVGSTGAVSLQFSRNGGSTWETCQTISNSLNLGLALTGYNDFPLSGDIPAGALVRLNSTSTNATVTYQTGEEKIFN